MADRKAAEGREGDEDRHHHVLPLPQVGHAPVPRDHGERYNHVSFSLDDGCEIFYSFNLKGFAMEKPRKHFPGLGPVACAL